MSVAVIVLLADVIILLADVIILLADVAAVAAVAVIKALSVGETFKK
jgi:hypothetical protein